MSNGVSLEFAAENHVGFDIYGKVIIKEKAQERLHIYQIQGGHVYQEIWSKNIPDGANTTRNIAISDSGNALLQDKSTLEILELSSDGRTFESRWNQKGNLPYLSSPRTASVCCGEGRWGI